MEAHMDREMCAKVVKEDEDEDEEEDEEEDIDVSDDEDVLKRRIATHPLYEELVEIHLDCLKVGVADEAGSDHDIHHIRNQEQMGCRKSAARRMLHQSDLDHFMEAYCVALNKLREAMEEPQQESMAFISSMHSELQEMAAISISRSDTPPTSSGN